MKQITIYSCLLLALLSFKAKGQQQGFELSGHLDGLIDGKVVYLTMFGDYEPGTADSCIVSNGNFIFKGLAQGGPRIYQLQLTENPDRNAMVILNNNEKVTVSCDSSIQKIMHSNMGGFLTFHNGRSQREIEHLLAGSQMYAQALGAVRISMRKIRDSIGFNPQLTEMFLNQRKQLSTSFYYGILNDEANYEPILPLIVVGAKLHEEDPHTSNYVSLYNRLSENTKNTFYGMLLKQYASLAVGQPFPDFTLPSTDGSLLSTKDQFPKAKMTIIHFWTSNSIDKAKYQDELKFFYKKYHDKGLNIIGVYAGKYMDVWKDETKEGAYPWINVADLKGKEGPCQKIYREPGNPNSPTPLEPNNTTNVLVDANGSIIAWDARGNELQYYLWKKLEQ